MPAIVPIEATGRQLTFAGLQFLSSRLQFMCPNLVAALSQHLAEGSELLVSLPLQDLDYLFHSFHISILTSDTKRLGPIHEATCRFLQHVDKFNHFDIALELPFQCYQSISIPFRHWTWRYTGQHTMQGQLVHTSHNMYYTDYIYRIDGSSHREGNT